MNFHSSIHYSIRFLGEVTFADGKRAPLELATLLTEEELAPIFAGDVWAGTRVWRAAMALIDLVLELPALPPTIVELGAGVGVPGMVCARSGARVCLTDVESVTSLLAANVAANFAGAETAPCAEAFDWSAAGAAALWARHGPFDAALCADCIFEPLYGSPVPLADALAELIRLGPRECSNSATPARKILCLSYAFLCFPGEFFSRIAGLTSRSSFHDRCSESKSIV